MGDRHKVNPDHPNRLNLNHLNLNHLNLKFDHHKISIAKCFEAQCQVCQALCQARDKVRLVVNALLVQGSAHLWEDQVRVRCKTWEGLVCHKCLVLQQECRCLAKECHLLESAGSFRAIITHVHGLSYTSLRRITFS